LRALDAAEKQQRTEWDNASWGGGVVRGEDLERLLIELRTRADAYASLREMTVEDLAAWLELKPDVE
jgi:hypothetical protein